MGLSKTKVTAIASLLIGAGLIAVCFYNTGWSVTDNWGLLSVGSLALGSLCIGIGLSFLCKCQSGSSQELNQCIENLNEAQEKLLLQEKLVQVGLLTAGIAHEIKNPLNFVTNFSKMSIELMDEFEEVFNPHLDKLPEEDKEDIQGILDDLKTNTTKVEEHGKRAESIVLNMLAQSRSEESIEKEPVDINPLIVEFLNLAYHGLRAQDSDFNIKIEKELDASTGIADIISQPIGRVVLNIINNGMYAAYKRSQSQDTHQPVITVKSFGDAKSITIQIRDNGTGITQENLENIFIPFYTTKPKGQGTGLGLSICHDIIVKDHNGSIDVESVVGEFTEFTLVLPRKA